MQNPAILDEALALFSEQNNALTAQALYFLSANLRRYEQAAGKGWATKRAALATLNERHAAEKELSAATRAERAAYKAVFKEPGNAQPLVNAYRAKTSGWRAVLKCDTWVFGKTLPYLSSAKADTLDAAIIAHDVAVSTAAEKREALSRLADVVHDAGDAVAYSYAAERFSAALAAKGLPATADDLSRRAHDFALAAQPADVAHPAMTEGYALFLRALTECRDMHDKVTSSQVDAVDQFSAAKIAHAYIRKTGKKWAAEKRDLASATARGWISALTDLLTSCAQQIVASEMLKDKATARDVLRHAYAVLEPQKRRAGGGDDGFPPLFLSDDGDADDDDTPSDKRGWFKESLTSREPPTSDY